MNSKWFAALVPLAFVAAAEQSDVSMPGDAVSTSTNIRGQEFPKIDAEGRVTFRIKAPDAQKVECAFFTPKRYPAQKGDNGFWTATTDPQVPGFHYYRVFVDGAEIADPASLSFYGTGKDTSGIEIPEKGVDFYSPKDVPHGEVRERWYFSKTTHEQRRIFVYTPPGYDNNRDTRYPVLYLQHGGGEDETGWPNQGRVSFILDNLLAAGKAQPMLIVMEQGYARRPGEPAGPSGPPRTGGPGQNPRPDLSRQFSAFEEVMVGDLIPMIDATYRTIPDRDHRAMAGLSMGGMQTFQITLKHLDLFSYIGGFSGGGGGFGGGPIDIKSAYNGVMANADEFNKKVHLVWLGVGTAEGQRIREYHEALDKAGIKNVYYESPGTAHEWLTWRRCLHEFAPLLFAGAPVAANGERPRQESASPGRAGDKAQSQKDQTPPVVDPGPVGGPPSDAIVLFDGKDLSKFRGERSPEPKWKLENGVMETTPLGGLFSKEEFGNCQVHVEWAEPAVVKGDGQGRGNSGVYLMGRYEIQVLDSYNNPTYPNGQCGAFYGHNPPLVNVCRKPGEWQAYDIIFNAPKQLTDGKIQPGSFTVLQNGALIQDHIPVGGEPTTAAPLHGLANKGPLYLQDHGNPVRFRLVWVRRL